MGKPWEYKWRIVGEPLGSGGQGATHLAESTEDSDTHAALKILKNRKSKQARLRMRAEVASLQVLSSAGGQVPAVIDHNTDAFEDTSVGMYVAMAYAPGRTLRAAVEEDGPYDYSAANRIIDQVCKTLELAHEYPILHRDLKPDNVIICDPDNTVVIVDYGLSFNDLVSNLTVTGETFRNSFLDLPETNTPGGDRRDARSDVTAACALYYFSLTGHSPGQLQDAQGRLPHRRPGYGLPDGEHRNQLEHLFDQGFAPEIGARFQTIADFQQRVHTVSKQLHSGEPDDPIKVAQEVSQLLEQRDRRTQLRGYEGAACRTDDQDMAYLTGNTETSLSTCLTKALPQRSARGFKPSPTSNRGSTRCRNNYIAASQTTRSRLHKKFHNS